MDDGSGTADEKLPESPGDSGLLEEAVYFHDRPVGLRVHSAVGNGLKSLPVGGICQNSEFYAGIPSAEHGHK